MSTVLPELAKNIARNLETGAAECVICTESIGRGHPLWSCRRCYGVLHLPCMHFWADNKGSEAQPHSGNAVMSSQFRCPLCQTAVEKDTLEYRCFCGQVKNPKDDPSIVPGTCGQTCDRRRPDPECPHRCIAQCHPGPCPPCGHLREQGCFCGAEEKTVGCSSLEGEYSCENECGRELNCGRHYCESKCHPGKCAPCMVETEITCYCGQHKKAVKCSPESSYSCGDACNKMLDCGNHRCTAKCHDGACVPCLRTPERQKTCACGKIPTEALGGKPRRSCLDPVKTCGQRCGMPLPCGHECTHPCHDGECPPCGEMVEMGCRCGRSQSLHPCFTSYIQLPIKQGMGPAAASSSTTDMAAADDDADAWDPDNPDSYDKREWVAICDKLKLNRKSLPKLYPPRCPRRCGQKKLCGKHACDRVCCGDVEHICAVVCRKRAPCGIHECGQLCHRGPCPPCSNVSFDPLFCRCRRSVVDPPVPCNTAPPRCNHPCIIPRPCGHPASHTCHQGDCPPCVVPVEKVCASHKRKWEFLLPCHLPNPSCGKRCDAPLTCCLTRCQLPCHNGPCTHKCDQQFAETIEEAAKQAKKKHR